MKIVKSCCVRCRKLFDFELYNGLCPHCGCFHRAPGVSMNVGSADMREKTKVKAEHGSVEAMYQKHLKEDALNGKNHMNGHKDSMPDPHDFEMRKDVEAPIQDVFIDTLGRRDGSVPVKPAVTVSKKETSHKKKMNPIGAIVVIIAIVSMISSSAGGFESLVEDVIGDFISDIKGYFVDEDDNLTDLSQYGYYSQYEDIHAGDFTYCVGGGYTIGDHDECMNYYSVDIPEDKKVIVVDYTISYSGKLLDEQTGILPYVYDGNDYAFPDDTGIAETISDIDGYSDYVLDTQSVFGDGDEHAGYCFYVVDKDCEAVTVSLLSISGDSDNPEEDATLYYVDVALDVEE